MNTWRRAATAVGQCFHTWLPGAGMPGVDSWVHAITAWDPEGPGPAAPIAVLASSAPNAPSLTIGSW